MKGNYPILMKRVLYYLALISGVILTCSWGSTGHYKISYSASLSFNQEMYDFSTWTIFLADHASDADLRKNVDPDESPKHYIDIDNYPGFTVLGRIPQTLDSAINIYGRWFVYGQGILPWATVITFDSLKNCFQRGDFEKARYFAADLGHYVADGHMPLHITSNYNGQYTGNDGIHSRYESTMINANINQITYTGNYITAIDDVNQYVFDYLYVNHQYVDSILLADDYAKNFGATNTQAYKQALWNKTGRFTTLLFKNASHALAELIYTAWVQAGRPSLTAYSIGEPGKAYNCTLNQNVPNPFSCSTAISYSLKENSRVTLRIINLSGDIITTLTDEVQHAGDYTLNWTSSGLPEGVYYLQLITDDAVLTRKMVHINR